MLLLRARLSVGRFVFVSSLVVHFEILGVHCPLGGVLFFYLFTRVSGDHLVPDLVCFRSPM